ncbi:MAG: trigger factor [Tannerella sp.]|jgi:trigger factor|nr:trigger factor [Tannerella sp.]
MNVSIQTNDALSRTIKVEVTKDDYAESCKKSLHKLRQQAQLPGFRKGMAPLALLEKKYGQEIKVEEIDKLVVGAISKGIKDNNLDVLGQPMPSETDNKPFNFDTDETFEFSVDIALRPEIDAEFTKDDHLPWYKIKVEDQDVDEQIDIYRDNYGTYEQVEIYDQDMDMLKGRLTELEGIVPKEGGIVVENTVLMPIHFKDETEKGKFAGARTGDRVVFNPFAAYAGTEAPLAALLNIEKEKVKDMTGDFTYEINTIERYKAAELNDEFYAKLFGEEVVKDEAGFREKVREIITGQYASYSQQQFSQDALELLKEKVKDVSFADSILKRWIRATSEKTSQEDVEEEYPEMIEQFKRQLIVDKIMNANGLTVEKEDLNACAIQMAYKQLQSYGMHQPSKDMIEYLVSDMMKNEQTVTHLTDIVSLNKATRSIQPQITLDEQEVTIAEFTKLTKETKSTESDELTESTELIESDESTEAIESTELTESTEETELN